MKTIQFYLLISFTIQVASQECMTGCQKCRQVENNQQIQCDQCLEPYQLHNGDCIYQGCSPGLYFQINQNQDNKTTGNCFSICDPHFYSDIQTNTCKKLVQCSSTYSTQQNFNETPLDFFIYKQQYYVALLTSQLSIYDQSMLGLVKNLKYEQDDLTIQQVNGSIIAIKNDLSIKIWDIINEIRNDCDNITPTSVNQKIQFAQQLEYTAINNL
ncbi:kinase domain protein (macronuclear) [Tetrahymena thermophila SB210]|uniref:Kinase domain protein n=1 Tax=Tetrahymena thermophila (strain SB210) TaxID=312017 RepID=Q246A5_TETTS|nr:kinase domain protein [Tetrahymena thermophila SB210]EAS03478.1 kinase domain protein [Tetrahymena thermophila SB210]|eukprot:XP_001023723.1 kinase domain protein [Tetrahymena thermophila SB210]